MSNNNGQERAGKVAVVAGGSRGIGAAIAKQLAAKGQAWRSFTSVRERHGQHAAIIKIVHLAGVARWIISGHGVGIGLIDILETTPRKQSTETSGTNHIICQQRPTLKP